MRGLQAGDMLAWFTRRDKEDTDRDPPRKRRKDFQALIGFTSSEMKQIEHRYKYFDALSLKEFFSDPDNSDPAIRWYGSGGAWPLK
jgi:hypothetical protein